MTVLSDPSRMVPRVWHPWRAIRNRPEITVRWEQMDGRLGQWCQDTSTITLDPRQLQVERRCTAMHELIHAERGHHGCQPAAVELAVHKDAARRLIGIYQLTDALVFHGSDLTGVAEECWVDQETLRIRLEYLHPAERAYIQRRLAEREGAA